MKKGLSEEDAAIEAYKKDRTQKALAVAAGVAIAAAAGYAAYQRGQYANDTILEKGTLFSRVAQSDNPGVHDAFYAALSKNKVDVARYNGIYAGQLRARGAKVFNKQITANADIKIASPKHAAEVMSKTLDSVGIRKNPKFASELKDNFREDAARDAMLGALGRANVYRKASGELDAYVRTGKVGKNLYNALNINLAQNNSDITKQFYKDLKSAGYQGIKDINDSKFSGFMTKMPVIVADASKVKISAVRQLSDNEIAKANALALNANLAKGASKLAVGIAGAKATKDAAVSTSQSMRNVKIVSNYMKEHPNSKMSSAEIIKRYELQQLKN